MLVCLFCLKDLLLWGRERRNRRSLCSLVESAQEERCIVDSQVIARCIEYVFDWLTMVMMLNVDVRFVPRLFRNWTLLEALVLNASNYQQIFLVSELYVWEWKKLINGAMCVCYCWPVWRCLFSLCRSQKKAPWLGMAWWSYQRQNTHGSYLTPSV